MEERERDRGNTQAEYRFVELSQILLGELKGDSRFSHNFIFERYMNKSRILNV